MFGAHVVHAGAVAVAFRASGKRFGTVGAFADITLQIQAGGVVALLGPHGVGKSMEISLMLALRRPSAGTVRVFGGHPQNAGRAWRVGAVLQSSGLPPGLGAAELVDFA